MLPDSISKYPAVRALRIAISMLPIAGNIDVIFFVAGSRKEGLGEIADYCIAKHYADEWLRYQGLSPDIAIF